MREDTTIKAKLSEDFLMEACYWIINKYRVDGYHTQQNSSRGDLIGGFIDRWINRIPETLIFNALFEREWGDKNDEKITVVNDTFLYTNSESKTAPDILGLKKDSKYYPFVKFNDGYWDSQGVDFPFVEMKTFRDTQHLITIPKNQFDLNHFYAIVESKINQNYLLSLFSTDFFEKDFNTNENLIEEFKISDRGNQLKNIQKIKKVNDLGFYELLGIYKGSILDYYSIVAGSKDGKPDKPRYLSNIEVYAYDDKESIKSKEKFSYFSKTQCIPVFFEVNEPSEAKIIAMGKEFIIIKVFGQIKINGEDKDTGVYKLNFREEIRNPIRYYILKNIVPISCPEINHDISLNSGLYRHYGDAKNFINLKIDYADEKSIKLIKNNKTSLYFEVEGTAKFNDKEISKKYCKIDLTNPSEDNIFCNVSKTRDKSLKIFEMDEEPSQIAEKVQIPLAGDFTFFDEIINYEPINIELHKDTTAKFLKTNKEDFSIFIDGPIVFNKNIKKSKPGFYKFYFDNIRDEEGNEIYKLSSTIEELNNPIIDENLEGNNDLESGLYKHLESEENNVPVSINVLPNSSLKIVRKNITSIIVKVKGKAEINGQKIDNETNEGFYKLTFNQFNRSSEKDEIILSKKAVSSCKKSSEKELLNEFEKFIENFNK